MTIFWPPARAREREKSTAQSQITPGAGTPGRSVSRWLMRVVCRSVGCAASRFAQSRRGWMQWIARAFAAALCRAGNGPSHDHVTTWRSGLCSTRSLVCQYAQTTLALYAPPLVCPPLIAPSCNAYTYALPICTMHPLSSTRVHYTSPLCTWTRAYSLTCARIHARTHARIRGIPKACSGIPRDEDCGRYGMDVRALIMIEFADNGRTRILI